MNKSTDNKGSFRQLLQGSLKSSDTEEWLDIYFTRPIGLIFALMWRKLGVHPNTITILSIFLGVGAGWMFSYVDLYHNLLGVILLLFANFCDSTDGQLARLTGQKTIIGRCLDGFAGDVWFFAIYLAIVIRLWNQPIPNVSTHWGLWGLAFAVIAGVLCHSPQSSLSDYYRQIHLYFLKGEAGSELNSYASEHAYVESLPKRGAFWERAFHGNYQNYCKSQEVRTPAFQSLLKLLKERYGTIDQVPQEVKEEFLTGSRPIMPFTNILTFNTRAICLYVTCVLNCPWVYLLFEITVMEVLYIYMHKRHERLCKTLINKINNQ